MGVKKFKSFEIKENETIHEMFTRFTIIVNELITLSKKIHNTCNNRKNSEKSSKTLETNGNFRQANK